MNLLQWREPLWLLAAVYPLPLWAWTRRGRRRGRLAFADPALWPWLRADATPDRETGRRAALALAWVLLAVAAAGPRLPLDVPETARPPAGGLMAVLDLSRSMDVRDADGSRRAAGLRLLRAWNDTPGRPPLGLVVYAGRAHLVFPPSPDRTAVAHLLAQLDGLTLPTLGNDLAGAVALAAHTLAETAGPRMLVLLGDGDLDPPARTAAETEVAALGRDGRAALAVVGLGGPAAAPVPDPDRGWLAVQGRPVVSRRETAWLERVAGMAGGRYLEAAAPGGVPLAAVWQAPAPRVTARTDAVVWRELFPWALLPALALLAVGVAARLPVLAAAVAVAGLGATPAPGEAADAAAAYAALGRGAYAQALAVYREIPGPQARYGEGVACFQMEDWACAAEAFSAAAWLAEDDAARGRAAFSLAAVHFRRGDYAAAARLYRDAGAHGVAAPALEPLIGLSDTLADRVEARRREQAGAAQRASAGPGSRGSGSGEGPGAEWELDLAPPPPAPLPAGMSADDMDELVERGLEQARLAEDGELAGAGTSGPWHGDPAVAAERSGTRLWARLFELEEGFPAPLAAPRERPGQRPW